MQLRTIKFGVVAMILSVGAAAIAAGESEYQAKLQEDLDYYKPQMVNNCGVADGIAIKFVGKLGSNPRESQGDNWGVSQLCSQAIEAVVYSCQTSEPVKKAMTKLKSMVCTRGSGELGYSLKGSEITLTIDVTHRDKKNTGLSPKDHLVDKLKSDLDK
jgi:hypothetical protein